MMLDDWMIATSTSDKELAARVSVDRTTINRIRRGKLQAGPNLMARIVAATGGKVSAQHLLPKVA